MTNTEIRTALETLTAKWRREAAEYPVATDLRAGPAAAAVRLCADELDALLSALPGETALATIDHQERADRFRRLTTPVPLSDAEQLPDPDYGFGDTGPAPPPQDALKWFDAMHAAPTRDAPEGFQWVLRHDTNAAGNTYSGWYLYPLPAPPRALVEVVREWRDSDAAVRALNADGGGPDPDAFGSACDRYDVAVATLRAYPLPAPEAPDTPR